MPANIIKPAIRKLNEIMNMITKSIEISLKDCLKVANNIPKDGKKAFNILINLYNKIASVMMPIVLTVLKPSMN